MADSDRRNPEGEPHARLGVPPPTEAEAAQAAIDAAGRSASGDTHNPISLLEIAGRSALYSGIQAPLTGAVQLLSHITGSRTSAPRLFAPAEQAQFGTAAWYAQTIGSGAGFMLPFVATEGLTRLSGNLAARAAGAEALDSLPLAARFVRPALQATEHLSTMSPFSKALFDGGLSGFLFTPSQDSSSGGFWKERVISAAASSTMFGVQAAGARALGGMFAPAAENAAARTGLRLGINAASGALGGMASSEVTSLLGTAHLASSDELKQSALAAAATGFTLDAAHLRGEAIAARRSASGTTFDFRGIFEPGTQTGQDPVTDTSLAAIAADVSDSPPAVPAHARDAAAPPAPPSGSIMEALNVPFYKLGEPGTEPARELPEGTRKFAAANGREFWQLPDGRIYHETQDVSGRAIQHFWSPYGSEQPAFFLLPGRTADGFAILTRDEAYGLYAREDGTPHRRELVNDFLLATSTEHVLPTDEATMDQLLMTVRPLESDREAAQRVIPQPDGKAYESGLTPILLPKEGMPQPPADISQQEYVRDYLEYRNVPTRTYRVAAGPDHELLADLQQRRALALIDDSQYNDMLGEIRRRATPVVVPEDYAKRLDTLRKVRRVATLDPGEHDGRSDQILAARRMLFLSPYADRFLPEHLGQFLDTVPNRRRIDRVLLMDMPKPEAAFEQNKSGNILADADMESGRVRFFGENYGVDRQVRRTLNHEWAHLSQAMQPDIFDAFKKALQLEHFAGRSYALKNEHENWAVHTAEMFMDPNPQFFITLAERAPLRTLLLAHSLARELMLARPEDAGINNAELQKRLKYVDTYVAPQARQQFMKYLLSKDSATVASARAVFDSLWRNPNNRPIAEKLVDSANLHSRIDASTSDTARDGRFDYNLAMRQLLRYGILEKVNPQEFARRSGDAATLEDRLRAMNTTYLLNPELGKTGDALSMAESLAANDDTNELFKQLYPKDALEQLTYDRKAPEEARWAFAVLKKGYKPQELHALAINLVRSQSPAKGAAASFIISESNPDSFSQGLAVLRKQMANGDLSAFTDETLDTLRRSIATQTRQQQKHFQAPMAVRTIQRARLLAEYLRQDGATSPTDLNATDARTLSAANQLEKKLTGWFTSCLADSNPNLRKAAIDAVTPLVSSSADLQLARAIAPKQALEQAITRNTEDSKRAFALYRRLYTIS